MYVGAIIHYRPDSNNSAIVYTNNLLLIDSGSQYLDGTTDVTRTLALGKINQGEDNPSIHTYMKECYTRVLKGHIALAGLVFPIHTLGSAIDSIARIALWRVQLNYGHGTGHGVGAYLNVHEGPHGIGSRKRENEVVSIYILSLQQEVCI